jgi:hypothetical protein
MSEPEAFLRVRFLKPGCWATAERPLKALGLRLVYPQENGQIVLSLDVGEKRERSESGETHRDVLIANANYHRDCRSYPADEEAVSHIRQSASDWSRYGALVRELLGIE